MSDPTETSGAPLRVMSFNVRYATAPDGEHVWPFRRQAAFSVIREAAPDVVGLQEALASQLDEFAAELPEFGRLGSGRDDGKLAGEFAAILYRKERIEVVESGDFWFSDTPETPGSTSWGNENVRMCTFARLRDRLSGRCFWHYNLHIDHASHFSRINSIALLLERIEDRGSDDSVVVTGDFNVGEGDEVIRRMVDSGLVDTFRACNPDAARVATYHGFTGADDGDKIDYIFCSPGCSTLGSEILTTQLDGQWPSDHFPIVADLSVG